MSSSRKFIFASVYDASMQQYHRDTELFDKGVCPVCLKQVGSAQSPSRHAMVQHFHRHKKLDVRHALCMSYKQYFKQGRSSTPLQPVQVKEIVDILHKYVHRDALKTIAQQIRDGMPSQ